MKQLHRLEKENKPVLNCESKLCKQLAEEQFKTESFIEDHENIEMFSDFADDDKILIS